MKKESFENFIWKIKSEMKEKFSDFKGIYFFGSRARGDFA